MKTQSVAASFVSRPSGILLSEPAAVFESTTVSGRTVPSTSEYVRPSMTAAAIAPS